MLWQLRRKVFRIADDFLRAAKACCAMRFEIADAAPQGYTTRAISGRMCDHHVKPTCNEKSAPCLKAIARR
jgi:hypothetical protein